jgi:hypothetical protein
MKLHWNELGTPRADLADGEWVEITGWPSTALLVLSHTSLTDRPVAWTRRILPDHARVIASTRGVIGIWPVIDYFPTYAAYADGFARMVDAAGVDQVGCGYRSIGLGWRKYHAELREPAAARSRATGEIHSRGDGKAAGRQLSTRVRSQPGLTITHP